MIHIPRPTCFGPSRLVGVGVSLCILQLQLQLQGKWAAVFFLSLQREINQCIVVSGRGNRSHRTREPSSQRRPPSSGRPAGDAPPLHPSTKACEFMHLFHRSLPFNLGTTYVSAVSDFLCRSACYVILLVFVYLVDAKLFQFRSILFFFLR